MSEYSELHQAILRYVKSKSCAMRDDILHTITWDTSFNRKDVQQAFTHLRQSGDIYRVPEGWYQTDVTI